MNTQPLVIDGLAGPVIVTTSAFLGHPAVTVGGQPAPRVGKRQYTLPAAGGGTVEATVRTPLADPYPTLEINGVRHRTGPKLPVALQFLTLVPIGLVVIGGALGGLVGGLGLVGNLAVARTGLSTAVKAVVMVAVAAAALMVLVVIAASIGAATGRI